MLRLYNDRKRKIAMGLLGFHKTLKGYNSLLKEIDVYEKDDQFKLWLWSNEGSLNTDGLLGVYEGQTHLVLYDISLNPSMRGKGLGFVMLDELSNEYASSNIIGTAATQAYLAKWNQDIKI